MLRGCLSSNIRLCQSGLLSVLFLLWYAIKHVGWALERVPSRVQRRVFLSSWSTTAAVELDGFLSHY